MHWIRIGPLRLVYRHIPESDEEYETHYVNVWLGYRTVYYREW